MEKIYENTKQRNWSEKNQNNMEYSAEMFV